MRVSALSLLLLGGCGSIAAPSRLPPSLATLERAAAGVRIPLPNASLFLPEQYDLPTQGDVPLFLHFQGGRVIAEENFVRMRRRGVLVASTLSGRSSKFATPYRDPTVFRALLATVERELSERAGRAVRCAPIHITFFSAGYGAVREFLKHPEFFARIDSLVAADSIYASLAAPGVRVPRAEQMQDFLRFAQAAARGEKTMVIAHTGIVTPYASTAECADLLLAAVGAKRATVRRFTERGVPIAAEAHAGGFHLYSIPEVTAASHMDCLYMIPELVHRHLPLSQ